MWAEEQGWMPSFLGTQGQWAVHGALRVAGQVLLCPPPRSQGPVAPPDLVLPRIVFLPGQALFLPGSWALSLKEGQDSPCQVPAT